MEVRRCHTYILKNKSLCSNYQKGQWDMLVNLVNKYGVVPKSTFPESSSSEAALLMNKFLRTKVYLFIEEIYVIISSCF
jgi:aminopeptidase C